MIVKDLIKKLEQLPLAAEVLVQGYEDGYDTIRAVQEIAAKKNPEPEHWWNGEYCQTDKNDNEAISAVVIFGNRRQG